MTFPFQPFQNKSLAFSSNQSPRREIKAVLQPIHERRVFNFLKLNKLSFSEHHHPRTIHSIYFDDSEMSSYFNHVLGIGIRVKHRIRTYDDLNFKYSDENKWIYELKSKNYDIGEKTRSQGSLSSLISALKPLKPKLLVSYKRHYFSNNNQLRVTLDQEITYSRIHSVNSKIQEGRKIKRNLCILEIKAIADDSLENNHEANKFLKSFKFRIRKFSKFCDAVESLGLIDI